MSRGTMVGGSGGIRYLRPELVADLWPNVEPVHSVNDSL